METCKIAYDFYLNTFIKIFDVFIGVNNTSLDVSLSSKFWG